jgi:hypothetical protein
VWCSILTRIAFLDKYNTRKTYIMNECSSQITHVEHAKIIYNVINTSKKKSEQSLPSTETRKSEKTKCHVCWREGHKMKKCWLYGPAKSLEESKKAAEQKRK